MIWTIIIFLVVLSVLVLFHELGHFLAARKFGVKVLEFGLGMPPKIKTLWKDKMGTEFTLNWLPFGGFVAMEGENGEEEGEKIGATSHVGDTLLPTGKSEERSADFSLDASAHDKNHSTRHENGSTIFSPSDSTLSRARDTRTTQVRAKLSSAAPRNNERANNSSSTISLSQSPFYTKEVWQRFVIIAAGPIFSIMLGLVAFMVIFGVKGIPEDYIYPRISEVMENTPAQEAGLQADMRVVRACGMERMENGVELGNCYDMNEEKNNLDGLIKFIGQYKGKEIMMEVATNCQENSNECTAERVGKNVYVRTNEEIPEGEGAMGVAFAGAFVAKHPWYLTIPLAIKEGFVQSFYLIKEILMALGGLITDITRGKDVGNVVAGPVGMVNMVQKTGLFEEGIWAIISFAAMLSINLGIMNFLPFPALDGGRLVLIALEKIVKRERIVKAERILNTVGFLVLMGLMILITGNDIWRLIAG